MTMDVPIYTCQRRYINASPALGDSICTYRMFFIDETYTDPESDLYKKYGPRQRRWKIFLWEQDPHIGEWVYPDISYDDPVAYCDVADIPGFETMIPPTIGWVPDIKISVAKGCYAITNLPGDAAVDSSGVYTYDPAVPSTLSPTRFYIPFGQKQDTIYPGTSQEEVVTTTYFQQSTYNDGTENFPELTDILYLYFKVTAEIPGGFWILARSLAPGDTLPPDLVYASSTPTFPPVFTSGTAPFPVMELNANWVASAYAPPRNLTYAGDSYVGDRVGETVTPIQQAITAKTEQSQDFGYENISEYTFAIEWPFPHGFGNPGEQLTLTVSVTTGTPPAGLVNGKSYEFTIVDPNTISYSGILDAGSPDFTGTLRKVLGSRVLATVRTPIYDTPVASEGDSWTLNRLWQFFPKHYEMHHLPYASYNGEAEGTESTTRTSEYHSSSDIGRIGARCNTRTDPSDPTPEHRTTDGGKCNGNSAMNMSSTYSNHITPELTESSRIDRVDWLEHNGELGGDVSGSYDYNSSNRCTLNGDTETETSVSKSGAGLGPQNRSSYMRIVPITYDYDKLELDGNSPSGPLDPYNEIGTYGEFECSASASMMVPGTNIDKTRQPHVHPDICPDDDYNTYVYAFTVATVSLSPGDIDDWETCHSALTKVQGKTPGAPAAGPAFFGRQNEFEAFIRLLYLGDDRNPCIDGSVLLATDCCNWSFSGGPATYILCQAKAPGGAVGATQYKIEATRVKTQIPVDNAHQVAPLLTHTVHYEETMGFGSAHSLKGYNYQQPIGAHDVLLHCPLSIGNQSLEQSSFATFNNSYHSLEVGTAKIVTESKTMTSSQTQTWSKGITDEGLVLRTSSANTTIVWDKVTTDITFDPLTGLVLNITTTPEHTEENYPEYQEASVTPTQPRLGGFLLSAWQESSSSSKSYYFNTHGTVIF